MAADGHKDPAPESRARRQLERAACRGDVFHFLENYCWIEDPNAQDADCRNLPLILWPAQRELVAWLVEGVRDGEDRLVNKARELGVSWVCALVLSWFWLFEPGFKAKLGSWKEALVDNFTSDSLFGKLRYNLERLPNFLLPEKGVEDVHLRLVNKDTGAEILGEATNRGFGRGGRRTVVFLDEFAHVLPEVQNAMVRSLQTVAKSVWRVSTPNGRGNRFHLDCMAARKRGSADYRELPWTCRPTRTPEWFDALLRERGGALSWDEREQEHNCSFAAVSGERILRADAERIVYTEAQPPEDIDLAAARKLWFYLAAMDFGSGPSLTVCVWLLVSWDHGRDGWPLILIDRELVRQRVAARDIGPEIAAIAREYGGTYRYVGDPAGRNAESDQESWETNLQAAGVPLECLPAEYNDATVTDNALVQTQRMLDLGLLRVHAERAPLVLETIESWQWDIAAGIPLELANRATIKPRKDKWSHMGDAAFRYGVASVLRMMRHRVRFGEQDDAERLPGVLPTDRSLDEVYSRLFGETGGHWS